MKKDEHDGRRGGAQAHGARSSSRVALQKPAVVCTDVACPGAAGDDARRGAGREARDPSSKLDARRGEVKGGGGAGLEREALALGYTLAPAKAAQGAVALGAAPRGGGAREGGRQRRVAASDAGRALPREGAGGVESEDSAHVGAIGKEATQMEHAGGRSGAAVEGGAGRGTAVAVSTPGTGFADGKGLAAGRGLAAGKGLAAAAVSIAGQGLPRKAEGTGGASAGSIAGKGLARQSGGTGGAGAAGSKRSARSAPLSVDSGAPLSVDSMFAGAEKAFGAWASS